MSIFKRCILFTCVFLLSNVYLNAQSHIFNSSTLSSQIETELSNSLVEYQVFELEDNRISESMKSTNFDNTLKLNLGNAYRWEFELYPNDIFSEDASIRVLTENGEYFHPVPRNISFKGNVKGYPQQEVSLLIHDDFIYAHITEGTQRTYITSLSRFIPDAPKNLYLVFDREDQITDTPGSCGLETYPQFESIDQEEHSHNHEEEGEGRFTGLCYDVDLGVVSDYSMFTDKGSTVQGVIDHVVAVMTDVETDYTTSDIDDALEFEIVEQVISICSFCDEWTASTDPSDLLSEFTNWSISGGFNSTVDMGQFWTNRDFDGTTVGLAYRASGLLCSAAYHVLQDYTSNAANLRVMTSHEIGHNLNASHDAGSGDIMAPSVSSATTWSAASLASINPEIDDAATASCITSCAATPCDPVTDVSITSVNATGFTISWTATTEGDYRLRVIDEDDFSEIHNVDLTSSGSMVINPAGWEICHRYKVIVENDCGSGVYAAPVSSVVADIDQGCAEFDSDAEVSWGSATVNFTDASTNATSWSWTFGDGNTSTSQNPSNTYSAPGAYEVTLSVNSGAHTKTKSNYVFVLPNGVTLPYTLADGGNMDDDDFGTESITTGKSSIIEKGVPSNYFSNSSNCWVTNLDGDITSEANEMALYSPSYDFTNATAATVSFDLGMEVQFCNGPFGVQLQYSTNNGTSWTRLGADSDASWYNRGPSSACQMSTVVFADEMGWTISSSGGTNYSYNVDALVGNSSVIFRFVFSVSDLFGSGYDRAGMMVDDFEISASLLPVELIAFDGALDKDVVKLNWTTSSEVDNDYFIIEKSFDGQNFEKLTTVPGQGNSTSNKKYETEDERPFIGVNYYRLTQVDLDGTKHVSDKTVVVEYDGSGEVLIQPNPSRGNEIQLVYQIEKEGTVVIEIFDTAGRLIKSLDVYALKARNIFDISLDDFSNGIYFIRTTHRRQILSLRFVKTD